AVRHDQVPERVKQFFFQLDAEKIFNNLDASLDLVGLVGEVNLDGRFDAAKDGVVEGGQIQVGGGKRGQIAGHGGQIGQLDGPAVGDFQEALARAGDVHQDDAAFRGAVKTGVEGHALEAVQAKLLDQLADFLAQAVGDFEKLGDVQVAVGP